MDDLLIILLTLLFTILAAVNRKNKKHPAQQGSEKKADPLREIFREMLDEPFSNRPVIVAPSPAAGKIIPVRPPAVPPEVTTRDYSGEGARNEIVAGMITQKAGDDQQPDETLSFLEDFSVRKAVIYSEILHPRYF